MLWIPSRVGIPANEIEDAAAERALPHNKMDYASCLSFETVKSTLKPRSQETWNRTQSTRGYHLKQVQPDVRDSSWHHVKPPRVVSSTMSRLRTGPSQLNHGLYIYIYIYSDVGTLWRRCRAQETDEHFIFYCQLYSNTPGCSPLGRPTPLTLACAF